MSTMHTAASGSATLITAMLAIAALAACGSSQRAAPVASGGRPIMVQDGATYAFQPAAPPSPDGPRAILTAQQAYRVMLRQMGAHPGQIPSTTTAMFGYLTEDDTMPPANQMPVWAFRVGGGCINTLHATDAKCFEWTFARAVDGKDLHVVDQETVS